MPEQPANLNQPEGSPDDNRLVRWLDRLGAPAVFGSVETAHDYLRQLDFKTFDEHHAWAKAMCLDIPAGQRNKPLDGQVMLILEPEFEDDNDYDVAQLRSGEILYIPPAGETATALMEAVFQTAQRLDDPEAAATLLLGLFFTHRSFNGNTRTSALIYALLTTGYDGSTAHKRAYAELTRGRQGLREVGLDIEAANMARQFAVWRKHQQATRYGCMKPLPETVNDFRIADLLAQRPDLDEEPARWSAILLAERYFGVALATDFLLDHNDLERFLRQRDDGSYGLDGNHFFDTLRPHDMQFLHDTQVAIKREFIRSLISCFEGEERVYGHWQGVVERYRRTLQPGPGTTANDG